MEIIKVEDKDKMGYKGLLLLADEDLNMIEKYLHRGDMFALYDGGLKSICVVTNEGGGTCELKNLATYEKWQHKGYGGKLISYISSYYKGKYNVMLVGTGDVPRSINFYQKNGFSLSHRAPGFFINNYSHVMFEDGIQLIDMVYLSKNLNGQSKA
ncbi:MAG: GNAT family N-acetyltransferase [Clostridiales bacterium]|jgi:GNAT superfamily N-acetyltransferase|nr:GNAT family N-acetyltransferase [Clostridiales bacterium]